MKLLLGTVQILLYHFREAKQDGIHSQGPTPPMAFSVPMRNKKLEGGEEGEGKGFHLKTNATTKKQQQNTF